MWRLTRLTHDRFGLVESGYGYKVGFNHRKKSGPLLLAMIVTLVLQSCSAEADPVVSSTTLPADEFDLGEPSTTTTAPAAIVPLVVPPTTRVTAPATQPRTQPIVPQTQAPAPPAPKNVSYANCTAVRAAGAAPIRRGDPGYASHLDRDDDGIGCE